MADALLQELHAGFGQHRYVQLIRSTEDARHVLLVQLQPSLVHEVQQAVHGGAGDALQLDHRLSALLEVAAEHGAEEDAAGAERGAVARELTVVHLQNHVCEGAAAPVSVEHLQDVLGVTRARADADL